MGCTCEKGHVRTVRHSPKTQLAITSLQTAHAPYDNSALSGIVSELFY